MKKFPEKFDSLEQLSNFIKLLTVKETNYFIQHTYSVGYIYSENNVSDRPASFRKDLLKIINITDKNDGGIQVTDKATNLKYWLDYEDFSCAFIEIYPLKLSFDVTCKGFPRIGFCTPTYGEFILNWNIYNDTASMDVLPDKLLEFFIGDISVSVSLCSPMWDLLIGLPAFCSFTGISYIGGFQYETGQHTLKFSGVLPDDIELLISQALYIINSNLNPEDKTASVGIVYDMGEIMEFSEVNTPIPNINGGKFLLSGEANPFLLFITAKEFVDYYRILEYFFLRARFKEVDQIRRNDNLSEDEFYTAVEKIYRKNEVISLEILIKQIADERVYDISKRSGLISTKNANELARKIYDRRCSMVHGKENEEPFIPSVFTYDDTIDSIWTKITRLLAINAIEKYCYKKM